MGRDLAKAPSSSNRSGWRLGMLMPSSRLESKDALVEDTKLVAIEIVFFKTSQQTSVFKVGSFEWVTSGIHKVSVKIK